MSGQHLNLRNILEMVEDRLIDPKEGLELISQTRQGFSRAAAAAAEPGGTEALSYQRVWEKSEIPPAGEEKEPVGCVLVFVADEEVYAAIKERLGNDGITSSVVAVKPGGSYRAFSDTVYEINPENFADYGQLLGDLGKKELLPRTIIHLWSGEPFADNEDVLRAHLRQGVYAALYLNKALIERGTQDTIKIMYISGAGNDEPQPHSAAMGAFARTVRLEHQRMQGKVVEALKVSEPGLIADMITRELQTEFAEVEVRHEGGHRWVKRWKEIGGGNGTEGPAPLRDRGVYMITGGVGGLGQIFAEHLAREVKARLALVGRSELHADKRKTIEKLEAWGAEVEYIRADISNRGEVDELMAKVKSRFREIHGIIHAAGVIRDSFVVKKTKEEMDEVLAPKVYGTVQLDEATKDEPLDFFVMFSSIAGVMGNRGQSDYAYANSFMDHYARLRAIRKRPGKTLSINWPLWKDGGMRVDKQTALLFSDNPMGIKLLEREAGLKAFERGLAAEGSQFMPLMGDRIRIQRWLEPDCFQRPSWTDTLQKPTQADEEGIARRLQEDLLSIVSDVLRINRERVDSDSDMSKFGFDSISFAELSNKINEKYRISVAPTIFFEHSSLRSIVLYLAKEYRDSINKYYTSKASMMIDAPADGLIQQRAHNEEVAQEVKGRSLRHERNRAHTAGRGRAAEGIAIIGMSGVMPQSEDLEEFWRHLEQGRDLISEIPRDRWDWRTCYGDPMTDANKTQVKWGGFMKEVDKFDPLFFNISPREAEVMDPQERITMELVWKAIEDAGYRASDFSGTRTGLFIGISNADYRELLIEHRMSMGVSQSILANRISYYFNLRGPSEPVDTACSSSLVAIHRGVEAIQNGHCEMSLVGGVNVIASPNLYVVFNRMEALSEDGRCKTFDKRANGYARGEGAGVLVLKPLSRAEADGDHIYGVIKGTAVNHGGHASSFTAPNPKAQAEVLIEAYEKASVDPATVSYIETHGTGTGLGDPIEIEGLKKAFQELYKRWNKPMPKEPHCGLGAVKTNIGHLESAAGAAGVIKVLLAMRHKRLPASIHFEELNPYIQLEGSPFSIITEARAWGRPRDEKGKSAPLRAGVSSFGIGGVNAHVVLEEYESPGGRSISGNQGPHVVVFSAKDEERLREQAGRMASFLEGTKACRAGGQGDKEEGLNLADIAYTQQVGREAMEERLAVVVSGVEELRESLVQYGRGAADIENLYRGNVKTNKGVSELLSGGEEERAFMRSLIAGKRFHKLARMWVSGVEIDWKSLYTSRAPRRISLPTYPFAKQRYWIPEIMGNEREGRKDDLLPRRLEIYPEEIPSVIESALDQVGMPEVEGGALERGQEAMGEFERWGRLLLLDALQRMGAFLRHGEKHEREELRNRLSITSGYSRLFDALLGELELAGFIELEGRWVAALPAVEQSGLQDAIRAESLITTYPETRPHVELLESCVKGYPEVLTGRKGHMEVMFPGGSTSLVENVYRGNKITDYYNQLVAEAVASALRQRLQMNKGGRIRVLEVGAGTGGTSAFVLERIKEHASDVRYVYTDISKGFTWYGEETYGKQYPFTEFKTLNIEEDPEAQGFERGSIDLVYGSNVLHATRKIDHTLTHIKSLLKSNGILLIHEAIQKQTFLTLTFGLTEGWWLFEDEAHRLKGSPLLNSGKWRELLKANGFRKTRVLGLPGIPEEQLSLGVIAAESDGIVYAPERSEGASLRAPAQSAVGEHCGDKTVTGNQTAGISPTQGPGDNGKPWREVLLAHEPGQRRERLESYLNSYVSRILKLGPMQKLDPKQPLVNLGLDSLMALQLRKQIETQLRLDMSMMKLLGGEGTADIAAMILPHLVEKEADMASLTSGPAEDHEQQQTKNLVEGVL